MDEIHNYYEERVVAYLEDYANSNPETSADDLSDMACIALNNLPSKYYRHAIDLSFYVDHEEQGRMNEKIDRAIELAMSRVNNNPRD
jgi:competence protein ComFB